MPLVSVHTLLQSPAGSTPCCFAPAVTSVLLAVAVPAMRRVRSMLMLMWHTCTISTLRPYAAQVLVSVSLFWCTADSEGLAAPPPGAVKEYSFDGAEGQAVLAALQADSVAPATVISSDGQAVLDAVSPEANKQPTLIAACEEHKRESQELARLLQNKLQWMRYLELWLQAPQTSMSSALLADLLEVMAECFVIAEVEKGNLVEDGNKLALDVVQSSQVKVANAISLLLRELPRC